MVRGSEREGVERYLGLPYAAPPIGHLRWREPQPAEPWRGTFDASQFPNRCLQASAPDVLHDRATPGEMSEDCLYLNIYTPAGDGAARLPGAAARMQPTTARSGRGDRRPGADGSF